ncbi:probable pectinesterase/pectinesterase inhibitor 25 [Carica papaya]|uniref:probable pectinesterase/pectinesterase inhibitor 25 n=1 Tax=Carica papaya TaxID=3649 RepID=UPI000B8CAB57|nr:probable pectinesterase/pectinesterase inhibitor 25 [Carica papaya]
MTSHSPSLILLCCLLFSWALLSAPQQSPSPSPSQLSPQPPSVPCKSTPYPKLCRTILSAFKSSPSDPYTYGKFSVKQCVKQAKRLAKVIHSYLAHERPWMTHLELGALSDCAQLAELSVDYLETVSAELKAAESMSGELVDRVTSLLSGVVTNQQTCFDGLVQAKSGFLGALAAPMANVTRLYSVSLGLVSHSMRRKKSKYHSLNKPHGVREHLQNLIKALRNSCHGSKGCHKRIPSERKLEQVDGGGLLVYNTVIVSPYADGDFTTINDAVASAPNNTKPEDGYYVIYAKQGYYEEYVVVPKFKKNIMLIGDGINKTIITGNHSVVDGWTTFNSSTFAVSGERFVGVDLTIRNAAGPEKHQAVALRNNADLSSFYRCSFEGYQDTLYVHSLRQFYRECHIYGTVDFIFGNAAVVLQSCNIYPRKPMLNQKNAITAQGRTDPNQNTGISIQNCTIEATPDLANDTSNYTTLTYLGRPWKEYSRTVFMESYIGGVVTPAGWLEWNGTANLDTLFYGEFNNYGPGANTSMRVQWPGYNLMNVSQAANYTVYNFTSGHTWLPDADIPFSGGLQD